MIVGEGERLIEGKGVSQEIVSDQAEFSEEELLYKSTSRSTSDKAGEYVTCLDDLLVPRRHL